MAYASKGPLQFPKSQPANVITSNLDLWRQQPAIYLQSKREEIKYKPVLSSETGCQFSIPETARSMMCPRWKLYFQFRIVDPADDNKPFDVSAKPVSIINDFGHAVLRDIQLKV